MTNFPAAAVAVDYCHEFSCCYCVEVTHRAGFHQNVSCVKAGTTHAFNHTAKEVPCPWHLAWQQSPAFELLPLQLWRLWGAAMPIQTARLAPKASSVAHILLMPPGWGTACSQDVAKTVSFRFTLVGKPYATSTMSQGLPLHCKGADQVA